MSRRQHGVSRRQVTTAGPWLVMAVVLAVALFIGAGRPSGPTTAAARAAALDAQLRCPSCEDVSVAQSSAPVAVAIRQIVERKVSEGQSDATIEAFLIDRYGQAILLRPSVSGGVGAVWIVPIAAIAAALAALGVFFVRRRRVEVSPMSDVDELLVEQALAEGGGS